VVDEGYAGGICTIHVGNGLPISEGGNDAPPLEEAIANARAIAAVPKLVKALEAVLDPNVEFQDAHRLAREALAAATTPEDE
jgi:hypothetical protein